MSKFVLVSTLVVWLSAVAILSLDSGHGFLYGFSMATIYSLPLLILGVGLYRVTLRRRDVAHSSGSHAQPYLGLLLAWIPNLVVIAVLNVVSGYLITQNATANELSYFLFVFPTWLLCVVPVQ